MRAKFVTSTLMRALSTAPPQLSMPLCVVAMLGYTQPNGTLHILPLSWIVAAHTRMGWKCGGPAANATAILTYAMGTAPPSINKLITRRNGVPGLCEWGGSRAAGPPALLPFRAQMLAFWHARKYPCCFNEHGVPVGVPSLSSKKLLPSKVPLTCSANKRPRRPSARPLGTVVASGALRLLIEALVSSVSGLTVSVRSESNLSLVRGEIDGVDVRADTIELNRVAVSGGVALGVDRLRLFPLTEPFAVYVSATLTEADLNRVGPVRDALQTLLREVVLAAASGAVGRE
eukprot:IDg16595t1